MKLYFIIWQSGLDEVIVGKSFDHACRRECIGTYLRKQIVSYYEVDMTLEELGA
jgi:hypothetical protein